MGAAERGDTPRSPPAVCRTAVRQTTACAGGRPRRQREGKAGIAAGPVGGRETSWCWCWGCGRGGRAGGPNPCHSARTYDMSTRKRRGRKPAVPCRAVQCSAVCASQDLGSATRLARLRPGSTPGPARSPADAAPRSSSCRTRRSSAPHVRRPAQGAAARYGGALAGLALTGHVDLSGGDLARVSACESTASSRQMSTARSQQCSWDGAVLGGAPARRAAHAECSRRTDCAKDSSPDDRTTLVARAGTSHRPESSATATHKQVLAHPRPACVSRYLCRVSICRYARPSHRTTRAARSVFFRRLPWQAGGGGDWTYGERRGELFALAAAGDRRHRHHTRVASFSPRRPHPPLSAPAFHVVPSYASTGHGGKKSIYRKKRERLNPGQQPIAAIRRRGRTPKIKVGNPHRKDRGQHGREKNTSSGAAVVLAANPSPNRNGRRLRQ